MAENGTQRLYISGPMTGYPDANYPAFHAAEAHLTARGYAVLNPARHGHRPTWTWQDYMRYAAKDIADADGVALLRGWWASRGAKVEVDLAIGLGLTVMPLDEWASIA